MNKSLVVQVIKGLSSKEKKKFKEFVMSPYYNKQDDVLKLLEYILQGISSGSEKKLDREVLSRKIFKNPNVSFQRLKNVSTSLMKLLEQFMGVRQFEKNKAENLIYVYEYAYENGFFQFLKKRMKKVENVRDTYPYRDQSYYNLASKIESLKMRINFLLGSNQKSNEYKLNQLAYMELSFKIEILKMAFFWKNQEEYYNDKNDDKILRELIPFATSDIEKNKDNAILMLYYKMYTMFSDKNARNYDIVNNVRLELDERIHLLSLKEANTIYTQLTMVCFVKFNDGDIKFNNMLFLLYKSMVKHDCLSSNEDGTIGYKKYYNIIATACDMKELDWAESFAKEFRHRTDFFKESIYNLCMAIIYYERGAFEKTMEMLHNTEFNASNSIIYCVKLVTLATYIELKEWKLAYYYIESFRVFCIRRKELSNPKRKSYLNYLKVVKKLLSIYQMEPSEERNEKVNALRIETGNIPNIENKIWLVEQFDNLLPVAK